MVHLSDSVNIYMAFTTIIISYTHSAMVNQYPDSHILSLQNVYPLSSDLSEMIANVDAYKFAIM